MRLVVSKAEVWDEVAKASAYLGDKSLGGYGSGGSGGGSDVGAGGGAWSDAYDRILMTDADQKDLQRFWEEAAASANGRLREMLVGASGLDGDYGVELEVSDAYDVGLNESVGSSLRSYFVLSILARWCELADRGLVEGFAAEAAAAMDDVRRKLYSRRRPRRPGRETAGG